jgi:hypothetical protein
MRNPITKRNPSALGELHHNQQEQHSARHSPRKPSHNPQVPTDKLFEMRDAHPSSAPDGQNEQRGRSPSKSNFGTFSLRTMATGGTESKSREPSPTKAKKGKSGMSGLLPRPKSFKNLYKLATDDDAGGRGRGKDKENCTPVEPDAPAGLELPPPIYAQFATDGRPSTTEEVRFASQREAKPTPAGRQRPTSFHPHQLSGQGAADYFHGRTSSSKAMGSDPRPKISSWERSPSKTHPPAGSQASFGHLRSKSYDAGNALPEPSIDPNDIDTHLEAMLDRRNIPENQRYKMRNLNSTIKLEFIRQDWAEMHASRPDRPETNERPSAERSCAVADGSDHDGKEAKPKRSRGKSFTLGRRNKSKDRSGGSHEKKAKSDGTVGRHFRTRSTDSIGSDRPSSSTGTSGSGGGILSKIKFGHGPGDYVSYLRKIQKPELVEVGKLHKLRLLLRNETVSWTEDFIRQGGMQEIVGLLNRIMEIEWR